MNRRKCYAAAAVLFLLLSGSITHAGNYTFTKIAETADGYSNLTQPSVNSSGTVAFGGTLGGQGHLFTSTGGVATPIYDQTILSPSINDSGQTSFISKATGGTVYRLTNGTLTPIDQLPTLYSATIANSGKVFYTGNTNLIPDTFRVGDGTTVAPVDGGLGLVPKGTFPPGVSSNGHSEISSGAGGVSVDGVSMVGTGTNFTEPNGLPGGLPFTQPFASFGDADINANKSLVFEAFWGAITHNIYRDDNGVITKVAIDDGVPAINDNNLIAALFTGGTKSLKVGPGAPTDTVLSVGDAFMGSTITDMSFSHEGFSDGNYLAFSATLADGRQGIYLTAVPEPGMLSLVLPAFLLVRRRRNSRR